MSAWKKCLLIGASVLAAMILMPPWIQPEQWRGDYYLIFAPPANPMAQIDFLRLGVQAVPVVLLTLVCVLVSASSSVQRSPKS